MDGMTSEVRYQHWVQVMQDWSSSGQTKRDYCQGKGIDEKQFYYYQRRVRRIIAEQAECQQLQDGNSRGAAPAALTSRPQIVRLRLPGTASGTDAMISFRVNGMNLSVPENIPASFLAKLLEAAGHGSR